MRNEQDIYLDHASTTPLDPRVLKVMLPYLKEKIGNPGSIHKKGVEAKKTVLRARKEVAALFSTQPDEIVFTSGGTESNNLAILGLIRSLVKTGRPLKKMHVISSVIEHSSVLEPLRALERDGLALDLIKVDGEGRIDLPELKKRIRPETVLVSIMYANNETGTIEPVREVAKLLRHAEKNMKFLIGRKPFFHIDASQTPLYLDMHVDRLGADLITIDAQKMYGPKGIGALFVRRDIALEPIIYGGGQERKLRGGTENVPSIVGLGEAARLASLEREEESKRLTKLREYIFSEMTKLFPQVVRNGDPVQTLPNVLNVSLPKIDTEFLTLQLDAQGFALSTKSTCMRDEDDSYVIKSLGGSLWRSKQSLRISLGRTNTLSDCKKFISTLRRIAKK
jgi:cysteine desulfurase